MPKNLHFEKYSPLPPTPLPNDYTIKKHWLDLIMLVQRLLHLGEQFIRKVWTTALRIHLRPSPLWHYFGKTILFSTILFSIHHRWIIYSVLPGSPSRTGTNWLLNITETWSYSISLSLLGSQDQGKMCGAHVTICMWLPWYMQLVAMGLEQERPSFF